MLDFLFWKNKSVESKIMAPTQVFSCEICDVFKNNFFNRTPPVVDSEWKTANPELNSIMDQILFTSFCWL